MASRNRKISPTGKSPKRPQIGYKVDPVSGKRTKTQARFNFGQDPKEREYRTILVRRFYEENCQGNGSEWWSSLALGYARLIEKGIYEIFFEIQSRYWSMGH